MDFTDNFNEKTWSKVEAETQEGFRHYQICRRFTLKGVMNYVLLDDDGEPWQVSVEGVDTKKDVLEGIANVEIKLNKDNSKIIGVMVDEECLLYNG